jgi:nitrite reductase/ring-hydroxylating ferredoxin subunit
MSKRTLIVGDVHGCIRELTTLLRRVGYEPGERLVFVGDLVAKGPDSRAVVQRALSLGAITVRGNHEEHLLRYRRAVRAGAPLPRLGASHRAIAEALSEEEWAYLEATPLFHALPEHGALVVHAGLLPGLPPERQRPEDLMNLRSIRPDGSGSSRRDEGAPWASRWGGPERVIFGHDAARGLQLYPYAIGLDTGCVYGGELTALELPSMRRLSVPAERVWCEPKGKPRPLRRVPVAGPPKIEAGEVRVVPLGRDARRRPIEALVVRGDDGEPHAYRNLCQHLPVPLDGGSREFLASDGRHLFCGTHGAIYRLEDGYCVGGPCLGSYLQPYRLREEGGALVLLVEEPSADEPH